MTVRETIVDTLGGKQKHIIIEHDDGSIMSFPANPENPHYASIIALVAAGELTILPAENVG